MLVYLSKKQTAIGPMFYKKVPTSKNPKWQEWCLIGPEPVFDKWYLSVIEDKKITLKWVSASL